MSHLDVRCEESKEDLCRIDELEPGEVGIDMETGATLLIVCEDGILSHSVQDFINEHDVNGNIPKFDRFDTCVFAVSLEEGILLEYTIPYRKVIKPAKAARLYVKE